MGSSAKLQSHFQQLSRFLVNTMNFSTIDKTENSRTSLVDESASSSNVREFSVGSVKVNYENRSEVREVPESSEVKEVLVRNFVCKKVDNTLRKRTEIVIGRRMIVLEDQYIFSDQMFIVDGDKKAQSESDTNASTSSSKAKEEDLEMTSLDCSRRDKKNVVKNIIKAFEVWLKGALAKDSGQGYAESKKVLDKLLAKIKFNNQLIVSILASSTLLPAFQEFLRVEAPLWLNNSKIKDRMAHQQTIDCYLRSCSTGRLEKPKMI